MKMACENATTLVGACSETGTEADIGDIKTELQDAKPKVTLNEPFAGNLSKYIPLPPGHIGPPSRGYLQFDACFEGGNIDVYRYLYYSIELRMFQCTL